MLGSLCLQVKTLSVNRNQFPWAKKTMEVRRSGEAAWIPMGDYDLGIGRENVTAQKEVEVNKVKSGRRSASWPI